MRTAALQPPVLSLPLSCSRTHAHAAGPTHPSANAQVSCAGQFVGNHLGDFLHTGKWLHVDIAYPSFYGARATGFGVGLLTTLASLPTLPL